MENKKNYWVIREVYFRNLKFRSSEPFLAEGRSRDASLVGEPQVEK
jgi:hypothetical protein